MKIYSLRLLRASVLVCLQKSSIIDDFFVWRKIPSLNSDFLPFNVIACHLNRRLAQPLSCLVIPCHLMSFNVIGLDRTWWELMGLAPAVPYRGYGVLQSSAPYYSYYPHKPYYRRALTTFGVYLAQQNGMHSRWSLNDMRSLHSLNGIRSLSFAEWQSATLSSLLDCVVIKGWKPKCHQMPSF